MNTKLLKILLVIGVIIFIKSNSIAQQNAGLQQKVFTKSDDILKMSIDSHISKKEIKSDRSMITKKFLDNGYVLVYQMGEFWNGTHWENSSLLSYTYTPEGLVTEEVNQFWNNGNWENTSRFLTTYYLNNLVSLYEQQNWNGTAWENSYQYASTYNADNQLIEYDVMHWNGTSWDNMNKTIYTYYSSGNLETIVDQQWDGASWINAYKYTHQYNSNDDLSEKLTEEWIEGNWKQSFLDEYSYNPQNQLELIASFWWSETFWKESVEIYYEYDGIGNVVDKLTKFWESEILGLQNKYHTTYEYLPGTSLEVKVENQEWILQSMEWTNTYREVKTYDGANLLQNYLMDVWDGGNWLSTSRENYSYDENGNLDVLISQYWNGIEWINSFKASNTWLLLTSVQPDDILSSPDAFSLGQNYPNPFNPSTTISFILPVDAQVIIRIYNSIGEEVCLLVNKNFSAGSHNINFKANNLVSGMYIYSIDAKGTDNSSYHSVKKMILLK
ncbi:MAG: T9SS type A sorting domain-containing protein [bacterium]|nr:T9SS type A sorting domain-containing protein [bacterium]